MGICGSENNSLNEEDELSKRKNNRHHTTKETHNRLFFMCYTEKDKKNKRKGKGNEKEQENNKIENTKSVNSDHNVSGNIKIPPNKKKKFVGFSKTE